MGRGHEGRPLFRDDDDREFLLDRLRTVLRPPAAELYAWSVPCTHYHLLLRILGESPGALFLRLNTALGRRERRRRGGSGTTFQDRYWSARCDGPLVRVLTYVLGNPAHHGMVSSVEDLERSPWSGYAEILGLRRDGVLDADATLALVDPRPDVAKRVLREAMSGRVARWRGIENTPEPCEEPGCRGLADACVLRHSEVGPVRTTPGGASAHDERLARRVRLRAAGRTRAGVVAAACRRLRVDAAAVRSGDRSAASCAARALLAYVLCDGVGLRCTEVARLLGVSDPAVTAARRRGAQVLAARGWTVDEVLAWP